MDVENKDENSGNKKGNSQKKAERFVVWAEAPELLDFVLEKREIVGNFEVKIMIDSGQDFLKTVCVFFLKIIARKRTPLLNILIIRNNLI